jgi:hypothetical protein
MVDFKAGVGVIGIDGIGDGRRAGGCRHRAECEGE